MKDIGVSLNKINLNKYNFSFFIFSLSMLLFIPYLSYYNLS